MPWTQSTAARFSLTLVALASIPLACKDQPAPAPSKAVEAPAPAAKTEPEPEPVEALPVVSEAAVAVAGQIDPKRYEDDLRFIAAARPPGSDHWQAVQDRCAEVFEAAGLETVRFSVEGAGVSVIGHKAGQDPELPRIVVGAHYDHIEDCPGADDNASGTAAVLELARVFGARDWQRSLTLACWDEEETGLYGSKAWVDAAVAKGERVAWYLNFDAIAYADSTPNSQTLPPGVDVMFAKQIAALDARGRRADFIALLADSDAHEASQRLRAHAAALGLHELLVEIPSGLKNEAIVSELRRSDHASFWRHDIPAVFLSDTANYRANTYHCESRPDTVETLDLGFAIEVVRMAAGGLAESLAV